MNITTKNIIKILPWDKTKKEEFTADFDKLTPEKKFEAEEFLWGFFDSWYALKLEKNTQLALVAAKRGLEKLDKDFYKRVKEKTEEEVENEMVEKVESADLQEARKAMQFIVKEIQASKKQTGKL